ncbi:MAG: phosphoribosyltransferase [Ignisphaera sp.]|nr:phosphoribosyltransferase [Ignisphaera sp.]MCX8167802.1 phosphoribosyltransferase [Ignisphaera sp.]MDW8086070.1 phosphoribosyltransferase [Ignisphaera sp.]
MDHQNFTVLTWKDIADLSIELSLRIRSSGYIPEAIVAILRGGYIIAKLVSDYLGITDISTVEIKFYRGVGEKGEKPIVSSPITHDLKDRNVLIVDDVADSGRTLQVAIDVAKLHGARHIKTATLYIKPWSITMPDYYVGETSSWIVFPWEIGEVVRDLLKRLGDLDSVVDVLDLEKHYDKNFVNKLIEVLKNSITSTRDKHYK